MTSTSGPLKKIGILGGTFDPPHVAHLKLATHFAKLFEFDELSSSLVASHGKKQVTLLQQKSATNSLKQQELI